MNDKELKELALRIFNGELYGSWRMFNPDMRNAHERMVNQARMSFLPLALAGIPESIDATEIAHVYAPMKDIMGSRALNGHPFFSTVTFIMIKDWNKIVPILQQLEQSQKDIIESTN